MMHRFANPLGLRRPLLFHEVEENRLDLCPFEDACLEFAGSLNWRGFSCKLCRIFLEEKERRVLEKERALIRRLEEFSFL